VRIRGLLPLSGIVFIVLLVLGLALAGSTPDPEASASEVAAFYGDNETRQRLATFVFALSIPFLLVFASSLAGLKSQRDPRHRRIWRRMLLAGSIFASATLGVLVATHLSLADGANGDISPDALQALNLLDGHVVYALLPAFGVMMLGAAGWLIGEERVQGWLGWAALVLSVGLFVPFVGFFALLLSAVWIVVASIALFRVGEPSLGTAMGRN
jgi:hypothetical protein